MRPYYEDGAVTIYLGDCREVMPGMTADAVFADPPYGADKAAWDSTFESDWLGLLPDVAPVAAITPGQRNLVGMPVSIGQLRYRWNWIPVLLYATDDVSLYGPRQDTKTFAIRGAMPNHPSPKPLSVMRWIVDCLPGSTVLDPFMGSGTTLLAAKEVGRPAVGIEVNEAYCELAARRCSQEVLGLVAEGA